MFDSIEVIKLMLVMLLTGTILGYLLTSWYQEVMLERQGKRLAECENTIEQLVAENDGYASLLHLLPDDN